MTKDLVTRYDLSADELEKLQFYLGEEITLFREVGKAEAITGSSTMVTKAGKTFEVVDFKRNTPGIATEISDGVLSISFEPNCVLKFAPAKDGTGRYFVQGERGYSGYVYSAGDVEYCGHTYHRELPNMADDPIAVNHLWSRSTWSRITWSRSPWDSPLQVDFDGLKVRPTTHVVPGRHLGAN
ncbi:MAG: hypothetical protein ABIR70_04890 [Bryobacteraceae bacterium]